MDLWPRPSGLAALSDVQLATCRVPGAAAPGLQQPLLVVAAAGRRGMMTRSKQRGARRSVSCWHSWTKSAGPGDEARLLLLQRQRQGQGPCPRAQRALLRQQTLMLERGQQTLMGQELQRRRQQQRQGRQLSTRGLSVISAKSGAACPPTTR